MEHKIKYSHYEILKEVLSTRRYILTALFSGTIFYILTALFFQARYLSINRPGSLVVAAFFTFYHFAPTSEFFSTITLSILTSLLISLLYYRFEHIGFKGKKVGFVASIGVFLGMAAPGCTSCGIGIAAAMGLGSSIAALPLKGLEISILSAALILFSMHKVIRSINASCAIPIS